MISARSRAESETIGFTPFAVESRPSSSYEYRKPLEESEKPGPEVVEALADYLKISLHSDQANFHWIVKACLLALTEEGWKCEVSVDGQISVLLFSHLTTGEKRSVHETVEVHKELAKRIMYEHEDLVSKRLDPEYSIQELVYRRLLEVVDSRQMSNPTVIEDIMHLLKIDISSETYLARTVREEIEAAFFKMKDAGGPNFITVENCFNVKELLARISLDRITFMKSISDSKLLFCVECRQSLADGICATCGDCLCCCCHSRLHSKGSRQDHLFVVIEQCICAECEKHAADIRCGDCSELFCTSCFKETHNRGKRVKHCVQLPATVYCFNCDFKEASLICLECCDALCYSCSRTIHDFEPRSNHIFYGVRSVAYPRKLFAANIDLLSQVIDRCLTYKKRKNWLLMYDSESRPYWYCFYTRKIVKTNMKNLSNCPIDPPQLIEEITTVTTSKARERALFEVPSNILIHFQPQIRP